MDNLKVYAKFIGKNRSCGYIRGRKYHLVMIVTGSGGIELAPPSPKETVCIYASLHSFLANWQVLG